MTRKKMIREKMTRKVMTVKMIARKATGLDQLLNLKMRINLTTGLVLTSEITDLNQNLKHPHVRRERKTEQILIPRKSHLILNQASQPSRIKRNLASQANTDRQLKDRIRRSRHIVTKDERKIQTPKPTLRNLAANHLLVRPGQSGLLIRQALKHLTNAVKCFE